MLCQLLLSAWGLPGIRAKSSHAERADDGISLDTLPLAVRDAGVAAFGSISALAAILKKTRVRQLRTLDGAVTLQLASIDGDKSVSHLRREMRSDRYEVLKLRDDGGDGCVVDVGANLGYLSLTVAKLYPRMRVLSIEPTPPTFFLLLVNLHLNRVPILSPLTFIARDARGVLPLHAATGGASTRANDTVVMHFPVGGGDSQLAMAAQGAAAWQPKGGFRAQSVPLVSLPSYLEAMGVHTIQLLKIDCEGCEWAALSSLRDWLTPPVTTPGLKLRFWRWPSWWPYRPRIERLVGELHVGPLEPDYDFELRRKSGRPVVRPEVTLLFETVRALSLRGCTLGLPNGVWLDSC